MDKMVLMIACLAGCAASTPLGTGAAPAQGKGMKLELLTKTKKEKTQTLVTALLRNAGSEPVDILLEFMLSKTTGRLTDDGGKDLAAHDGSSVRGQRAFGLTPIKTKHLKPGDEVEVGQFSINPSAHYAGVEDLTWDLKEIQSKTLTLELSYEVTEGAAKTARHHKAPDVAVGRWTSKPVALDFRK